MAKSKSDVKDIKDRLRQASTTTTKKQIKEYKVPEKKPAFDETLLRPQALVPPKTNTIVAWIVFAFALIIFIKSLIFKNERLSATPDLHDLIHHITIFRDKSSRFCLLFLL